jgi:hypothetical protein
VGPAVKASEAVVALMLTTREGVSSSPDGAAAIVVVNVNAKVLTEKKKTRTVRTPVTVSDNVPVPSVTMGGGNTATRGMDCPPVSRPESHRIQPGTMVGGIAAPEAALATRAEGIVTVGTVMAVAVAGDGGRAVSTPERRKSPGTVVSVTRTAHAVGGAGGTELDVNGRIRNVGALDVTVSNTAPPPPTNAGSLIVPVRTGKPAL